MEESANEFLSVCLRIALGGLPPKRFLMAPRPASDRAGEGRAGCSREREVGPNGRGTRYAKEAGRSGRGTVCPRDVTKQNIGCGWWVDGWWVGGWMMDGG